MNSEEFRQEKKRINMSKRSSIGLSPDSATSPDDLFSNYLRELTMAPTQLKKHQSVKVN